MVKSYKRTDSVQLSRNFRLDEFKCKCGKCSPILVDTKLIDLLQKIRDHFGKSVNVNSGYRCPAHNSSPKVGGNPSSHHLRGMAADIRVEGVTPNEVAKYAESIGIQRIGLYETFVHIGSADTKNFWKGHNSVKVDTFGAAPKKVVSLELPVLKRGVKSETVGALQSLLIGCGYDISKDNSFGPATEKAVKDYQRKNKLEDVGYVDITTWKYLLGL